MGALKVRVGGSWVTIPGYGNTIGVPTGGVANDLLIKNSATAGDARWAAPTFVSKAGDTMTGALTITPVGTDLALILGTGLAANEGAQMRFSGAPGQANFDIDNWNGALRVLQAGAPGGVGFQVAANGAITAPGTVTVNGKITLTGANEVLTFAAVSAYAAWWNGGTRVGYLQGNSNGLILASETGRLNLNGSDGIQLGTAKINGYTMSESAVGYRLVCSTSAGYIMNSYFNMTADVTYNPGHIAGMSNSDNYLRWYTQVDASKIGWGSTGGIITSTKVAGAWYYDQCLFANPGNTMAGIGFHPGGTAGNLRFQTNQTKFYFNSLDSGGFYNCMAYAFESTSSERGKQDIVPLVEVLPVMPRLPVATMVRALRPTWYRQREDVAMMSIPFQPEDFVPVAEDGTSLSWAPGPETWAIHECSDEGLGNCGHTPDDPCSRRTNWLRGYLGFIAEEVEQVLPHLVRLDADMRPESIDLGSLIGLAYAMLQELDSRLTTLEAA